MAKFKTVAKSLPEETRKDEHPGDRPVVFTHAHISCISSRLESLAGKLDNIYDLTDLAGEVEPEHHKDIIDGATYFIDVIKAELLRMHRALEETIEKAGGAA